MTVVLAALGTGALATVARATGARDRALQEREAATAIALALAVGAALLALVAPVYSRLAGVFTVPDDPESALMAPRYLGWIVLATPFILLDGASCGALRGAGDTRTPMLIAVFANILNVAGNYVLIFGKFGAPEVGVAGAGLSTAIALAVQGILVTAWMFTPGSALRLRASSFRSISRESVRRLVRLTLPAAVEPLVLQTGFLVFLALMKDLGKSAMADFAPTRPALGPDLPHAEGRKVIMQHKGF
jgi:putative MATE family efflux protein